MKLSGPIPERVTALAVLLVAVIPFAVTGLWAFSNIEDADRQREEQAELFDRLRSVAAFNENLSGMGASELAARMSAVFLPDGTDAVVSAGLQARLKQIADENEVQVSQTGDIKPREVKGLNLLGAHIEVVGKFDRIHRMLLSIESSEPYLFIETLDLGLTDGNQQQQAEEPTFYASMDVLGAVRRSAPGTKD